MFGAVVVHISHLDSVAHGMQSAFALPLLTSPEFYTFAFAEASVVIDETAV